jgi:hypothetical protein
MSVSTLPQPIKAFLQATGSAVERKTGARRRAGGALPQTDRRARGWVGHPPGRLASGEAFPALAGRAGSASADRGSAQPSTHIGTPEEDYRTAPLSDSPDAGCLLCGWRRERPRREAGPRYSEGRAQRGRGRSLLRCLAGALTWLGTDANEGPAGLQGGGPEAPCIGRSIRPRRMAWPALQNAHSEIIEMSSEFAQRLYVQALRTVRRGVCRRIRRLATTGLSATGSFHALPLARGYSDIGGSFLV